MPDTMYTQKYTIDDLLGRVELPSLPEAIIKLGEAISKDASMDKIVTLVQNEPALTARVLRLANSAWYQHGHHVDTIKEAITNIGFVTTYQLIVVSSIIEIFQGINSQLINMRSFWQQSMRMACAAVILAEHLQHPSPLRIFSSGMLSYIGRLILYVTIPSEMQKILLIVMDDGIPQHRVEQEILGFEHSELSASLLASWMLPKDIYVPIKNLYSPEKTDINYRQDTYILNISHYMQYTYAHDITLTDPPGPPSIHILQELGLNLDDLPILSRYTDNKYKEGMSLFLNN
ncbi:MAG: HDOD domain-containing protein [Gammaproteobacteria bacterium]|nr:HDOD domain-containing protein [Gammaproteobacteria bacterium]